MAVLFQNMCIRLGVVTGLDLAQACKSYFPKYVNWTLYVLAEIAIIATDLAEVIGSAIAMNLLFGLPLWIGVVLTGLDVLVILFAWKSTTIHLFQYFIGVVIIVTGGSLAFVVAKSDPNWSDVFKGFIPTGGVFLDSSKMFVAVGILGATVMPHNLYLHSNIVRNTASFQGEELGKSGSQPLLESSSVEHQPLVRKRLIPKVLMWSALDTVLALTVALVVNALILILAGSSFFSTGHQSVSELPDAYHLIHDMLSPAAATFFAFALFLSGQSSTITGTLAGQFVMEGFIGLTVKPWIRRIITRSIAIIPALVVVLVKGVDGMNYLLILSQVILSLQLPFAVWPLIYFTSSPRFMKVSFCETEGSDVSNGVSTLSRTPSPEHGRESSEVPVEVVLPMSPIQPKVVILSNEPTLDEEQVSNGNGITSESFANHWSMTIAVCICGILITVLNVVLIVQSVNGS